MLCSLLEWLRETTAWEHLSLGKITLRAALAAGVSFSLALLLGPRLIAWLRRRFREPNVSPSAQIQRLHRSKAWTPTMGGLFLVVGLVTSALVFGQLSNPYLLIALLLVVALAVVGAIDDLAKLRRAAGISAGAKLWGQVVIAFVVALLLYALMRDVPGGLDLRVPLVGVPLSLGWWYVPLAATVLVASSNAVNLTDGLDGLAGGCLICATLGVGALAYIAGHRELASYLDVSYVPGSGEMLVLAGAMIGGLLGFLWFNCHPAQVFMGDVGSLPLGGLLGLLAVVARQELLLLLIGGVFVAEAGSVIVQVAVYRLSKRRVFRCAPLHHHFQLLGWPESRVVVRFWIASALCAMLGIAGTKLRLGDHEGPGLVQQNKSYLRAAGIDALRDEEPR